MGPRLRAGLVAAYGPIDGLDAAAEALAYGWEHWDELSSMLNPAGYLYRVGQTAARRERRQPPQLPVPDPVEMPDFEPGLVPALEQLTEPQRVCVMLVHSFGWSQVDVADLLGVGESTVRTHLSRGLNKLRDAFEVEHDVR
ncbi:RNA polymerase sigma factor [Ilumatobacter fluminis]|uniref:RNA polymerase sigma factor n=1 Tax=Ilumatobacter fluminis TaxID=467091 RepID=UPI0032EBBBBC